jgi:hypothetical protein
VRVFTGALKLRSKFFCGLENTDVALRLGPGKRNSLGVSRAVTASAADAPPTRSGVEDPARIALSEVRREPARAIDGPGVVDRGSG